MFQRQCGLMRHIAVYVMLRLSLSTWHLQDLWFSSKTSCLIIEALINQFSEVFYRLMFLEGDFIMSIVPNRRFQFVYQLSNRSIIKLIYSSQVQSTPTAYFQYQPELTQR
jgi:hypothetical protein